jgi:hypothetical protein
MLIYFYYLNLDSDLKTFDNVFYHFLVKFYTHTHTLKLFGYFQIPAIILLLSSLEWSWLLYRTTLVIIIIIE